MEDEVTLVLFCSLCKRQAIFQDETFIDCHWQADMEGWVQDENNRDLCPICSGTTDKFGRPGR
jgi:rubrerythrin